MTLILSIGGLVVSVISWTLGYYASKTSQAIADAYDEGYRAGLKAGLAHIQGPASGFGPK